MAITGSLSSWSAARRVRATPLGPNCFLRQAAFASAPMSSAAAAMLLAPISASTLASARLQKSRKWRSSGLTEQGRKSTYRVSITSTLSSKAKESPSLRVSELRSSDTFSLIPHARAAARGGLARQVVLDARRHNVDALPLTRFVRRQFRAESYMPQTRQL